MSETRAPDPITVTQPAAHPPVDVNAIWSAHQLALAFGRLIERHHAQMRELIGHAQAGVPLGPADTEAVHHYREDLKRIHTVIETLESSLESLDGNGARHGP